MLHRPPPRHRIATLLRVASIVALAIFIVRPTSVGGQVIVASSEHPSMRGAVTPTQNPRSATPGGRDLTGTWLDQTNGVYVVTQSGSLVTWTAHSADNRQWGHNFTGTITGDIVEGDFQDVPPYTNRLSGHIKVRVVDINHMTLISASGSFGASSWTRQPAVLLRIPRIVAPWSPPL